jgi:predicted ATPase
MIVDRISVPTALVPDSAKWPWTIPSVAGLLGGGLDLHSQVTILVGENGSGKSTIVEAVAEAWGVDVRGGHSGRKYSSELPKTILGESLRLDRGLDGSGMVKAKAKGFFHRSETAFDVFKRLEYGEAYTDVSHGESYLQAFNDWFSRKGLFILDEPEAALSFTSCLSLVASIETIVKAGGQVICATHSPILASIPSAQIFELNPDGIRKAEWADLDLVQHWTRFLNAPDRYLGPLLGD